MGQLLAQLRRTIEEENLLQAGERIVVAVSGGPDSAALLHALEALARTYQWQLAAAHVDHGFRGEESLSEADWVEAFAGQLGIPCFRTQLNMPGELKQHPGNAQDRARELRYAFLVETANQWRAGKIALGHHADDQAETVLMRLLRGSGSHGLAGMPIRRMEKNVELVRPLLRIYKAELVSYCREQGIDYRTDSSNSKRIYTRNAIRLDVLPALEDFSPGAAQSLNRTAMILGDEDAYLKQLTEELFAEMTTVESGFIRLSASRLAALHPALQRRLIHLILSYLSGGDDAVTFRHIEQVRHAVRQHAAPNARFELAGSIRLERDYDGLCFTTAQAKTPAAYEYEIHALPAVVQVAEAGIAMQLERITLESNEPRQALSGGGMEEAWLDAERLHMPLIVRCRKPGDRMRIQGLNGSKKVKDMFIDAKIPVSERETMPLVTDAEDRVLWIPGLRRSDVALVSDRTRSVVHIRISSII
ncbi:tRNA lysidine(34) synthetase TilS [Xylanibacillus composti]|uniref:tRNA(Ile)-lysidine synthase n=1 Tax=Xylanibacillus composti TaxID=1572762 RepID=A0A8J4GY33_9BACL|nr:tRNA lysidine(34) synthetase TilS [Xylanibacillus composti]MDT9725120.1 tRNA lysidine(34) synthetase TilS [Xylanibacillus composti]GIQ67307.1 tRNA(Ile)-lysidine synthase [Xylanibacillus composti]